MKRYILILAVCSVACSTPSADQTDDRPTDGPELTRTAADDESKPTATDTPQPFRLEMDGEETEWFVPYSTEKGRLYSDDRVVGKSCGMHVFSQSDLEALVYCLGEDAPRLIDTVPGTQLLRFGRDDTIVAMTDDKRLLQYEPEAKQWRVRNDGLPAVDHADAVAGFVAVADKSRVWVSEDGGETFEQAARLDGVLVSNLLVRPDGTVVINGEKEDDDVAYSAQPPYNAWSAIRASQRPFTRKGAWITRHETPGTLAADGQTWVAAGLPDQEDWRDYLWPYSNGDARARAGLPRRTINHPPAPPADGDAQGPGGHGFGYVGTRRECSGAACLDKYPRTFGSHITYSFIGRYLCDHELAPKKGVDCPEDADIVHVPAQAAFDEVANDFLALKAAQPWMRGVKLQSSGGLGFAGRELADGRTQYRVTGPNLDWKKEAVLEHDEGLYTPISAPDGTMLFRSTNRESNQAWIRPPREPGDATSWLEVRVEGAIFYRPLPGGEALAVVDRSDETEDEDDAIIDLVRVNNSGEQSVVMERVELHDFDGKLLLVDDDGRVFLTKARQGQYDTYRVMQLLMDDGSWQEVSENRGD
ncbi:MAG: hypothetical protein ACQEVA_09705 [Myxococcota bacterium]